MPVDYPQRSPEKNPFLEEISAIVQANKQTGRDPKARGVFASRGQSTAQYEHWLPNRNHEYLDTMARMYIDVNNYNQFKRIRNSAGDIANIVDVLVGYGDNKAGLGYLDFLLHTAEHRYKEKMQISEVLSDNFVVFFFGQEAPIFSYTGTVYNTYQDNWLVNLYKIFQYLGRGTKLASRGVSLQLRYDSFTFFGAMTSLSWRLISGQETYAAFVFNFLVKKCIVYTSFENVPYSLAREDLNQAMNKDFDKLVAESNYPVQTNIPAKETLQIEFPEDGKYPEDDPYGMKAFAGKEGVFKNNTVDNEELDSLLYGDESYDPSKMNEIIQKYYDPDVEDTGEMTDKELNKYWGI